MSHVLARKELRRENTGRASALNGRTELIEVLEGAMQVTAGEHTACALLKGGGIRCRGGGWPVLLDPPVGRFIQVAEEPMAVPWGTFAHIASGDDASCGVATDGSLQCWGEDKLMAKLPPTAGTYTQVEMGRTNSLCSVHGR